MGENIPYQTLELVVQPKSGDYSAKFSQIQGYFKRLFSQIQGYFKRLFSLAD
jgi:hypothetical protein